MSSQKKCGQSQNTCYLLSSCPLTVDMAVVVGNSIPQVSPVTRPLYPRVAVGDYLDLDFRARNSEKNL
jgi:hypothetical protein